MSQEQVLDMLNKGTGATKGDMQAEFLWRMEWPRSAWPRQRETAAISVRPIVKGRLHSKVLVASCQARPRPYVVPDTRSEGCGVQLDDVDTVDRTIAAGNIQIKRGGGGLHLVYASFFQGANE